MATEIYSSDSQNVAVSSESELYTWGGNSTQAVSLLKSNETKLGVMEDLKRRKVGMIATAYTSVVVVTGQESY